MGESGHLLLGLRRALDGLRGLQWKRLMRRVEDYRENAEACRELAKEMAGAVHDHLLRMAAEWDRQADERERQLAATASEDGGTNAK